MSYKPDEAVILIVWTKGGMVPGIGGAAWFHSTIADTIRPISSQSELDYIKANLTQRKIPWDETSAANDDISGFGTRIDTLPERVADAVWNKLIASKAVEGSIITAADMLAYIDQHTV